MEPTKKQLDYIETIEKYLGTKFQGKTKLEATEWLNKYVPLFERQIENTWAIEHGY